MNPENGILARFKAKMARNGLRSSKRASITGPPSGASVSINVYDMLWLNVYTNSLGIGVYHTGVVVYETEYGYGGHPLSYSGIFAMIPQDAESLGPNYSFKTNIVLGYTDFTEADIGLVLEDMGPEYRGDQYHLLRHNCNHFSNAFSQILCGSRLPKWINRLATVGAKLPLVERSIPKMWLTPRPLQLEDVAFLEQQEAVLHEDHPSVPSEASASVYDRGSRTESICLIDSHLDQFGLDELQSPVVAPREIFQPRSLSVNQSVNHRTSATEYQPTAVDVTDNCTRIPSNSQIVDSQRAYPNLRSYSTAIDCSSSSSPDSDEIHQDAFQRLTTLPVSNFFAPKRPSSAHLSPETISPRDPASCSVLFGGSSLWESNGCLKSTVTASKRWPVLCRRTDVSPISTEQLTSPMNLHRKTKSDRRFSKPSMTPSSSGCSGKLASGFMSHLQSICGTSQIEDTVEPD